MSPLPLLFLLLPLGALPDPCAGEHGPAAGPRIATYRPERPPGGVAGSALARLDGRLAERDGCLAIAGEDGRSVLPVFPADRIRWEEATRTLFVGGIAYRIGSKIVVGGGGVGDEAAYRARPEVAIPECRAGPLFVVGL